MRAYAKFQHLVNEQPKEYKRRLFQKIGDLRRKNKTGDAGVALKKGHDITLENFKNKHSNVLFEKTDWFDEGGYIGYVMHLHHDGAI